VLTAEQEISLAVEKPAAGGRMIARHEGQVVLVAGAVPGERVRARVERVERRLAFATVVLVEVPSPDRRPGFADPLCGGCLYSHIAYARQLSLKGDVIRDAFLRLGRIPIEQPIDVAPSPERGYRMRARLHVHQGRIGFYREGTHVLCDAAATDQLNPASLDAAAEAVADIERSGVRVSAVELAENIAGDERGLSLEIAGQPGRVTAGQPSVTDPLAALTGDRVTNGELRRRPESFFQANRYLVPQLVGGVLDAVPPDGDVLDLYAGVGLFSIALAGLGRLGIIAVEGDRASGNDLAQNARPFGASITVHLDSVEGWLDSSRRLVPTAIVDPPRTGISAAAMSALAKLRANRIVYVSCDPATMARDARRLLESGYRIESLRAFDLFPNTPHVETLGVFDVGVRP
jgi:23S rRNA (uracil1939-C5)-methyltransferase